MDQAFDSRDTRRPTAIGFIRADISGAHQTRHAHDIRLLARRMGHNLIYVVRLWEASVPDPIEHVLGIMRGVQAATLIVPDLAHVGNQPGPVCDECDVITVYPEQIWAKAALAAGALPVLTMRADPSPIPAEVDIHLSLVLHGVHMDYRACLTAALVFVQEWQDKCSSDDLSVFIDGVDGLRRLPCESLYLEQ